MIRRITILSLILLAVLLIATPVLAYLYRAQVSITEGNGTDYDMLGITWDQSNRFMAENDYMETDALDTRVQTLGGTNQPHMVAVDQTLTASPISGNSQTNYYFVTGETDLTDMDIIVGDGGSVTTLDAAALEPGDTFSHEIGGGYMTLGADYTGDDIIAKDGAYRLYKQADDAIRSAILGNQWTSPTGFVDSGGTWGNEANTYDDNTGTGAQETVGATSWGNFLELTHASIECTQVRVWPDVFSAGNDKMDVDVYYNAGWHDLFEGVVTNPNDNNWNTYDLGGIYDVTSLRVRIYNALGIPHIEYVMEADFGELIDASYVTADGLSSGEYDVTTEAEGDVFDFLVDNGDVLHFNGGATNAVDCGAIHNNESKFWVFLRFELDDDFDSTDVQDQELFLKNKDASNYLFARMESDSGKLYWYYLSGGALAFSLTSTTVAWNSDQVYEVLVSLSDTAGGIQRLRVNGSLEDSDTQGAVATPAGGNFLIGYYNRDCSMIIHDVVVGTDDLLIAEETAMFNGDFPADAVNIWHLDEGVGLVAYDLGTGGNDGTIGAGCTWETGQRYTDFYLDVDGTSWGVNTDGLACDDNSADWVFYPDPYWEDYTYSVSGADVLIYNPNDMVRGEEYDTGTVTVTNGDATVEGAGGATWDDDMVGGIFVSADGLYYVIDSITDSDTLELTAVYAGGTLGGQNYDIYPRMPDRQGAAQDGAISWGSNPGGITVTVGSMVSSGQGVVGEEEDTETSDILPPAGTTDWAEDPDVTGALLTNPMRPIVVAVSDNTTLSERQVWVYFGLILLLLVTAGVSRIVHGHHLITGIAAAAIVIALSVMTIWPLWALVFAALAVVGGLVAERSPSL